MPDLSPREAAAATFGSIFDGLPLAIAATEGRTHLLHYANPAFCRLAGREVDALLGRPLTEALPEFQTPKAMDLLDGVYETGAGAVRQTVDPGAALAPGGKVYGTHTVWPILGEDHLPAGLLVQVSDTTDQVFALGRAADAATEIRNVNQRLLVAGLEAQEHADTQDALNTALRELLETRARAADERETLLAREHTARDQAEAALRVRDEFLAIASHELRSPLTVIKAAAQLALRARERGGSDDAKTDRHLRGILESADRLEELLRDLLDVSRMRGGGPIVRPRAMDLSALVESVARRYTDNIGDNYRLGTHLPGPTVLLDGDMGRLDQVLDNLLSNAVKYSPRGGEINVSLVEVPPRTAAEQPGALLTVTDVGIGLSPSEQDHIFEPFGRATNAMSQGIPGMGLGLYICRQIVEAHGGRLWVESVGEGHGTTFSVWLPTRAARSDSG